jgi:hypothetical protein
MDSVVVKLSLFMIGIISRTICFNIRNPKESSWSYISSSISSLNANKKIKSRVYIGQLCILRSGKTLQTVTNANLASTDFEGTDENMLKSQHQDEALELYNSLRNCKDGYLSPHINFALDTLIDALRLYGPQQILSSYNGGKDADVIMHLLRAVTAKFSADSPEKTIYRPNLVYFEVEDEFEEVEEHIQRMEERFCLNIKRHKEGIKIGIKKQVEAMGEGKVPAFVLGTRKGDPNCGNQETFSPSRSKKTIRNKNKMNF